MNRELFFIMLSLSDFCLKLRRDRDKLGNFGDNSIEPINNLYSFSENINQSNEHLKLGVGIGFPQNLSAIFGTHVTGYTYVRRSVHM